MQIPDQELANQLISFMHAIPRVWTWDQLIALFQSRERQVEYRGPESNPLTFAMEVLEHDRDEDGQYVHVTTHVCDGRSGKVLGSTFIPLCGSVFVYEDGKAEFSDLGNGAADEDTNKSFQPTAYGGGRIHG